MKKTYLLSIILFVTLISCKKKDDCYYLNPEELSFYDSYQLGEEFKLMEESTGDIKIFTITKKNLALIEPPSNGGFVTISFGSFGNGGDTFVQFGVIEFSDNNGFLGKISIRPSSYYEYNSLYFYLSDYPLTNYDIHFTKNDDFDYVGNYVLNGITYENVYYFKSYQYQLYYSINNGFLKIDEIDSNGVYLPTFTLVN